MNKINLRLKKRIMMLLMASSLVLTPSEDFALVEPLKLETSDLENDKNGFVEYEIQVNSICATKLKSVKVMMSPIDRDGVVRDDKCIELNYYFDTDNNLKNLRKKVNLENGMYQFRFETALNGSSELNSLKQPLIEFIVRGPEGDEIVYPVNRLEDTIGDKALSYFEYINTRRFIVEDGDVFNCLPKCKEELEYDSMSYFVSFELITDSALKDSISVGFKHLEYLGDVSNISSGMKFKPNEKIAWDFKAGNYQVYFPEDVDSEVLEQVECVKISGKNGVLVIDKDELTKPGNICGFKLENGNIYGIGSSMQFIEPKKGGTKDSFSREEDRFSLYSGPSRQFLLDCKGPSELWIPLNVITNSSSVECLPITFKKYENSSNKVSDSDFTLNVDPLHVTNLCSLENGVYQISLKDLDLCKDLVSVRIWALNDFIEIPKEDLIKDEPLYILVDGANGIVCVGDNPIELVGLGFQNAKRSKR